MKVYKFRFGTKFIYQRADNIIAAKNAIENKYKGAKFVKIIKVDVWK